MEGLYKQTSKVSSFSAETYTIIKERSPTFPISVKIRKLSHGFADSYEDPIDNSFLRSSEQATQKRIIRMTPSLLSIFVKLAIAFLCSCTATKAATRSNQDCWEWIPPGYDGLLRHNLDQEEGDKNSSDETFQQIGWTFWRMLSMQIYYFFISQKNRINFPMNLGSHRKIGIGQYRHFLKV